MPSIRRRLEALQAEAQARELTPVAWWIGARYHEQALDELGSDENVETKAGRLVSIGELDVKVLTESPERFALWCKEGVLDL